MGEETAFSKFVAEIFVAEIFGTEEALTEVEYREKAMEESGAEAAWDGNSPDRVMSHKTLTEIAARITALVTRAERAESLVARAEAEAAGLTEALDYFPSMEHQGWCGAMTYTFAKCNCGFDFKQRMARAKEGMLSSLAGEVLARAKQWHITRGPYNGQDGWMEAEKASAELTAAVGALLAAEKGEK